MVDPGHADATANLAGQAQDVAARNGIAQVLGQPRHLVGGDRRRHLPLQRRIPLQVIEKLTKRIQGRSRSGTLLTLPPSGSTAMLS